MHTINTRISNLLNFCRVKSHDLLWEWKTYDLGGGVYFVVVMQALFLCPNLYYFWDEYLIVRLSTM